MSPLRLIAVPALLSAALLLRAAEPPHKVHGAATVPQCSGVTLSAAYLAEVAQGHEPPQGPGFYLTLANNTDHPIKLASPVPSSAHWYAEAPGRRLLWRASSGSGGALVNAMNERGPLFAAQPPEGSPAPQYLEVAPHAQLSWAEAASSHAALRFRPGCERCVNDEDRSYRAVLAYAYLPPAGVAVPGLLTCGLRSAPVVMPPLPAQRP